MKLAAITTQAALAALMPEWEKLYYQTLTPNPFAHPQWMLTWACHYLKPSQVYVLTVRDAHGALVAVAPLYRWRHRLGPLYLATSIHLFGAGHHTGLTELTQVLVRPSLEREVLRTIIQYLCRHAPSWDWLELVLPPEQGWFEPQWLPEAGPGSGHFVLHKGTRACVLLPLPRSWDDLRSGLKRNLKESLRKGGNSLKRAGHAWEVTTPRDPDGLAAELAILSRLHLARAQVRDKVDHADHLGDPADRAFLRDVACRMFHAGHLTPCVLRIDGNPAAARLVLHANGATFFSISGFDPRWWPYNAPTTLMAECLRQAIARGDHVANLSPGPDVAKLRWSEQLAFYQEFLVAGPRRRSLWALALFWLARAAHLIQRERRR